MAALLDEQADRLANGIAIRDIPGIDTQQELARFVAELRLNRTIDVFDQNGSNTCRLTDFGTKVVEKLRQPDDVQKAIGELSESTREALVAHQDAFRQGRVSRADVKSTALEKLRRAGLLEVKTIDAGWWSPSLHKGPVDVYYVTKLGEKVLDSLCQSPSPR
ncbi:MAG: hypothetical protein U1B78_01820 [Dehalococcoidia bacterium]|nr:hypothetical protein [Dehalococcoidia bacterium]